MSASKPLSLGEKAALAVAMTWAAGFVDAVGYVSLYHVFTANMSGNSVRFGMFLEEGNWHGAFHRGLPIAMFMAGLIAGGILIEAMQRHRVRVVLALCLGVEALFLAIAMMLGTRWPQQVTEGRAGPIAVAMIAFMAAAMGVQNTSVRKIGALSVHTTHVTGELTHLSEVVVAYVYWLFDRLRHPSIDRMPLLRASWRNPDLRKAVLLTGLWIFYTGGAVAAAWGMSLWADWALLGPIVVLIGVIVVDAVRPVEIEKNR